MTLAGASVLVFHSAAFAQQAEGPAAKDAEAAKPEPTAEAGAKQQPPQDLPPEYAPPPGYRHGPPQPPPPPGYEPYYHDYYGPPGYPPPPRYYRPRPYYQPAGPVRYYPEPTTFRPFFFGFGLGVGGVGIILNDTSVYSNATRAGLGYNLRFGFGVSPRWSIVLSADGAQAYFTGANVSETAWTIGPQVFITQKLYARAGIGAATYSQDTCDGFGNCYAGGASDSGTAAVAAIGFEFMQHYHSSLALEASGTIGYFPNKDKVSTFGVNFVLNLF
jgi:hypothetical protein